MTTIRINKNPILTIKYYSKGYPYMCRDSGRTKQIKKGCYKITYHSKILRKLIFKFNQKSNLIKKIKSFLFKKHNKYYRFDLDVWENKISICGIIFYRSSVFNHQKGKSIVRYKLWIPRSAQKMYKAFVHDVYITHDEWVNEYKENRYLVPINYKIPEEFLK